MRRAVITGLGLVTPLGSGLEPSWRAILGGKSGAGRIGKFDVDGLPCQIACEVPRADGYGGGDADGVSPFNADDWLSPKEQRRTDDFIMFGIAAAQMAFDHSGVELKTEE
ncbi:MAG: beta-ketoacyl synthase N-terminal-like domain-containing protein, partial [Pseudomonadota bacterium]